MGYASLSDVGRSRSENQDSVACETLAVETSHETSELLVLVVADGMGGHHGGDKASAVTTEVAIDTLREAATQTIDEPTEAVRSAAHRAHEAVVERVHEGLDLNDAGTTLVAALVTHSEDGLPTAHVANVGDSRAYSFTRDAGLTQITTDQSYVQELVAAGDLDPDDADEHPMSHVLSQAVGTADDLDVDCYTTTVQERLLLCTDGLTDPLSDAEIATRCEGESPKEVCGALVEAANAAGGPDNVTVAVYDAD